MRNRWRNFLYSIGRLFSTSLGPLVLCLLVLPIVYTGSGWLTGYDLAYGFVLLGMVLARWLEFHYRNRGFDSGRSRARQLRQYVVAVLLIGAISWVFANVLGNHVSPPHSATALSSD